MHDWIRGKSESMSRWLLDIPEYMVKAVSHRVLDMKSRTAIRRRLRINEMSTLMKSKGLLVLGKTVST